MGEPTGPAQALGGLADDAELAPVVRALEAAWDVAFDPALTARGIERLVGSERGRAGLLALAGSEAFRPLVALLGASEFLATWLGRHPERLDALETDLTEAGPRDVPWFTALVRRALVDADGNLERGLRLAKGRAFVRIAARDLAGLADVEEVTAELSRLAEGCLTVAIEVLDGELRETHGAPHDVQHGSEDGEARPLGFVVLAMGKLGGEELNFSSDIDLIYLYDSDRDETEGRPDESGVVSVREYYTRLAERLTNALSRATEDGFAFRVDLRLRPMGASGAVVHSVGSALDYYESFGRTWERAALLKARPMAGNPSVGTRFLERVEPFVYRRYLDYETVEDMKEMKRRIDAGLGPGRERTHNVKLGAGGIREIEFIAQTLALVNGGRDPRVRSRSTVDTLDRLHAAGLLETRDHEGLGPAYRYLRKLEHRIQVHAERQSHSLPTTPEALARLARRMGHAEPDAAARSAALLAELDDHRANVTAAWGTLFTEPESERERRIPGEVRGLFGADEPSAEALAAVGFRDTARAARAIHDLREGPPRAHLSAAAKERLERVAPLLVAEALGTPDPDEAIAGLDRFLTRCGARGPYLALLAERPAVARSLLTLFGSSAYLTDTLLAHPELIDGLLRVDAEGPSRPPEALEAEISERLAEVDGEERFLQTLRTFRSHETLRVGFHDLAGQLDLEGVTRQLSVLAEVCVRASLEEARAWTRRRYGIPDDGAGGEARFVVLGMGKLGGCELQYASDLDLIFLFSPEGHTRDGPRHMANVELFARLVQRMISTLTSRTVEGIVYEIDTRLRPSGHSGPLVIRLDAFRRYHRGRAALWERQALIKARPVAGDARLAAEVLAIRDEAVYGRGLTDDERAEIAHVRSRMADELAADGPDVHDLKLGEGGLVDVEFAVQVLQLGHGGKHPAIRCEDTLGALDAIGAAGLLAPDDRTVLAEGYRYLREIERTVRLADNRSLARFPLGGAPLARLTRRLADRGLGDAADPAALRRRFLEVTDAIRTVYDRVVAPAPGADEPRPLRSRDPGR